MSKTESPPDGRPDIDGDSDTVDGASIIEDALDRASELDEEPISIEEYIDQVFESPSIAASSSEYLLRAIEHFGTRTVTEFGREMERWRFFDDPANDGEHAVIGQTAILNDFVEDLRQQARGTANEETIFWFIGPTASGKSEIKRCLINGVRAFSKTDTGRRYTVEWTTGSDTGSRSSGTYGRGPTESDDIDWHQSPIQANPLTILPESVRETVIDEAGVPGWTRTEQIGVDPFSEKTIELLEQQYGHGRDAHESILSSDHCRVVRYTMDTGRGIGVLQSEDEGRPHQKLVGEWVPGMVDELDSRGQRNPHGFAYDGVISQGNSGVSIIEDASHHNDVLPKMLNVSDDRVAKIDRRTQMDIDTVFVLISNPELREQLTHEQMGGADPFKALRRRLSEYQVPYLTRIVDEVELLRRLLTGETGVWMDLGDEEQYDRCREAVHADGSELAPHTLYAVACYEVTTRIVPEQPAMDRLELARLYNTGSADVLVGPGQTDRIEIDDVIDNDSRPPVPHPDDGAFGVPCTHTRGVLADLLAENDVVLPTEAIDALEDSFDNAAVFENEDTTMLSESAVGVYEHAVTRMNDDVLEAVLHDVLPTESEIRQYIEHVYCWGTEMDSVEPDDRLMRTFEVEHLSRSGAAYGNDDAASKEIKSFRENELIDSLNKWIFDNVDATDPDPDFLSSVNLSEVPVIEDLVSENSWGDVVRTYPNFNPDRWENPLEETETESIKEKVIDYLSDQKGYTEESARQTAATVVRMIQESSVDLETDEVENFVISDLEDT